MTFLAYSSACASHHSTLLTETVVLTLTPVTSMRQRCVVKVATKAVQWKNMRYPVMRMRNRFHSALFESMLIANMMSR